MNPKKNKKIGHGGLNWHVVPYGVSVRYSISTVPYRSSIGTGSGIDTGILDSMQYLLEPVGFGTIPENIINDKLTKSNYLFKLGMTHWYRTRMPVDAKWVNTHMHLLYHVRIYDMHCTTIA